MGEYNYRNDNGLLIHVSFFIIVKCMMFSPYFSYALGIIENNGLV